MRELHTYNRNKALHNNITIVVITIRMGKVRMNMKGKALLAGCIALAFSTMAQADIKVAVVGAMSGPVAQYGDQEFTGAEQAVADINAKGGIKGEKLQIVKYDDACDPKQAVAVANKVINDGIKYVIGHLCSSSTQPASDIYEDEGILMITPAATAPELTSRGYKLVLRTTGLDSDQGPTAAKYILEKVKPQRIAIVHDKQQYGEGLARAVQENLKKGNANVVFFDGITAGEKDFSTLVARLKKENIDFVYYGGYHPEMGQILRQARAAGLKTQFMGPEGVANVSLSNIAGESAEGLLVTKPKNYDQVPANKPIVDAIKAKKQDPSGAFVWTTYAALQSLQAGLNQSADPAEIATWLKANSVDTVMGPLSWDEKGDLKGFEFGVFDWHANGTATDAK
ncbi:leucine/isoleucine/valine transporter subunit; periplasmic-binding component of ABC superfamily [Citrobacter amalonaticus]|jgi:branched-chain amino acid transport system substrate-binding protein|uniref:Leu/Ile/Val-binding protein n=4 Tax=Enterobacteriaceae TaxID=543 RepID=A0A6N2TQN8_CITAM|nr:leucine/isoleucine/valine transporter subunit; periplasmic-binding component of ABC superfamily [Citrobacter amalonaticus]SAZ24714.1 leucine/isoleucine/valine transporter subunit; periplasmic-binding component of ABC superfamily [Citrobacter amalonaticus]SFB15402.1 L-leucine-binding protein /L-isoleucine-binding protein /L-valine-binding protein [Citrobacter amalonaticus]